MRQRAWGKRERAIVQSCERRRLRDVVGGENVSCTSFLRYEIKKAFVNQPLGAYHRC